MILPKFFRLKQSPEEAAESAYANKVLADHRKLVEQDRALTTRDSRETARLPKSHRTA